MRLGVNFHRNAAEYDILENKPEYQAMSEPPGSSCVHGTASVRVPATLLLNASNPRRAPGDWEVRPSELRSLLRSGRLVRHLFRHPSARLLVDDVEGILHPKAVLLTRLLTRGPAWIEDRRGRRIVLDTAALARFLSAYLRDLLDAPRALRTARRLAAGVEAAARRPRPMPRIERSAGVLFLRTDFLEGLAAGGSLAHLAGVLNELQRANGNIDLVTTDPIPLLDAAIRVRIARPDRRAWVSAEVHALHLNQRLLAEAAALARPESGRLIYQRYSIHNWTGAALSRQAHLPFVLEFNGSQTWVARNWGRPLRYEALASRIEQTNLEAADLVTVVSEPLRDVVLARGIPDRRILVNPNGVDAARFAPDRDGSIVRRRCDLGEQLVIGFIGTFGPWHGVDVLAEAYARLLGRRTDLKDRTRLMLIGDGERMPAVREILRQHQSVSQTVLTGLVPQSDGPDYIAACDILCVPTVPNPDGSPFFGSPTKLFECMAMGRPVAASALGQVTDILEDGRTGLLVPPSDPDALSSALERLVDDPDLRARLGAAGRDQVLRRYTWRHHVTRLFNKLDELTA